MKTPFKDPIAPKKRESFPTFDAPQKKEATTGRYMSAGDDYGVGFRTPVGKEMASGMDSGPIPQKSSCHNPDEMMNLHNRLK